MHSRSPLSSSLARWKSKSKRQSPSANSKCSIASRRNALSSRRFYGLLQLALDGKSFALSPYAQCPRLSHSPHIRMGTHAAAVPIQESAVRGFLYRLGARGVPRNFAWCQECFVAEANPLQHHVFLDGLAPRSARNPVCPSRPQDQISRHHFFPRRRRTLHRDLVKSPLCRATHLRDLRADRTVDSPSANHARRWPADWHRTVLGHRCLARNGYGECGV